MSDGIRLAEKQDIPALSEIWKICFHDSDDYIRFFYRENFDHITTTVYTVDGRPVSMLHWFDSCIVDGDERRKAKFLYAGGTLPDYRKNGYYAALFWYVRDYARENGFAIFHKPASKTLVPYYQTFGYEVDACFTLMTIRPGETIPINTYPVAPEEYNLMRNKAFSSHPHAEWPDRHVRFCVDENAFFGGRTLAVELDGSVHFLMGAKEENTLRITETDLSLSQLRRAAGALCSLFGTELLKAYLPDFSCAEGEEIVSSIVYNMPLRNTYVNLTLF